MKRALLLFAAILLSTSIFAVDYIVYGAGAPDVNGTYVPSGRFYNGYPVYEYGDYILGYNDEYGEWAFTDANDDANLDDYETWYYYTGDHDNTPASVWYDEEIASTPPVVYASAYIVANAGTSAVNGTYTFSNNYNDGHPIFEFDIYKLSYNTSDDYFVIITGNDFEDPDATYYYFDANNSPYTITGSDWEVGNLGSYDEPAVIEYKELIDYIVYGAGTSDANGTYVPSGRYYNEHPVYEYGDYILGYNDEYGEWAITDGDDSNLDDYNYWYYYTDEVGDTPASIWWSVENGSGDAPVVMPAAYQVTNAGTTEVNGLYVITEDTYYGVRLYVYDTYTLGWDDDIGEWFIVDTNDYDYYYYYLSNGDAYAPTYDTWSIDNGGSPAPDFTESGLPSSSGPSNPSPADGATEVALSGDLTWDFSDGTDTYDLKFGPAGSMSQVVTGGTAGASGSYSYSGLSYDAEMEWQVIEYHATDETIEGDVWSFTTYTKYATNPTPADDATDVAITTTFDWNDVNGADSYTIDIGTSSGGTDVANGVVCYNSDYTHGSNLIPETEYFWTVTSIISTTPYAGTEWSFTTMDVKADNPDPADNATGVAITDRTLWWDDVIGADSYTIDIGTTSGGTDVVNDEECTNSHYTHWANLIPGTEYFWTVTTIISSTPYAGTEWSFTTHDGTVQNPTPDDGATYVATNTTLDWDDNPGATGYTIDIGTSSGASDIVNDAACSTSEYTPASSFNTGSTYFWTVTSIINSVSYEGTEWSFTTSVLVDNQINDLDDLSYLTQHTELWSQDFVQTANIDASATQYWDYSDDNTDGDRYNDPNDATSAGNNEGWSPIGNASTRYTGTYDGGNHTISNLYIYNTGDYQGFMGYLYGSVINLGIIDIDFTITGSGDDWIGGICGLGRISSNHQLDNCFTTGSISAKYSQVGGLIGNLALGTISNCYSSVNIEGNGTLIRAGGFAGQSSDGITNCYSTGSLTNVADYSAGFCGYKLYGYQADPISNCYSTGDVSRASGQTGVNIAGFVNHINPYSETINCYCTGSVTYEGTDDPTDKGFGAGGGIFNNNFFNSTTSNQTSATGATALTNAEMQDYSNFTGAGWDFDDVWSISPGYNSGWPNLDGEETVEWTGTSGTSWSTGGNWEGGAVPALVHSVEITTDGVTQFPVIGSGDGSTVRNLTVGSGAELTIESGGSLITTGTVTNEGTVDMKRTISDGQWHLVSIPASGITANTFLGDYLQSWDETTGLWNQITEPTTVLNTNQGYLLWGTGSKSTYTFTGTPLTGNQSIAVTLSDNFPDPETGNDGANLLGNPYPSSIDWSGLDETWGAVYYYNGTAYVSWNNNVGSGSQFIPPMQGFFIVVNAAGNFELTNNDRTHSGATGYLKSESDLSNGLILEASNGKYNDALYILFRDEATTGFDLQHDAYKFLSAEPGISEIYSYGGDNMLSIDARPQTETIQLGFTNDQPGVYSIGIKEITDISQVYLEDTKTQKLHNLMNGDYEFSWNPEIDSETRFILHFKAVGVVELPASQSNVLIYSAGQQIFVKGATNSQITVTDISGRIMLQQQITNPELTAIPVNLATGIYIVVVQSGEEIVTEKVFIK